jgi:hypothetical protein
MRWVEAQFGLDAMIYPGKSSAQHVYSVQVRGGQN